MSGEDARTGGSREPTLSGMTLGASVGPQQRRGAPMVLGRGSSVGRYFILGELGQGGMGVVYVAYDPELDRRVAIKLLLASEGGTAADGRTRLLREAQALAQLAHPSVVAVHDVGTLGEQVWIAMEFIEGQTLSEWLQAPRSWREVLAVFHRAGEGLAAAHAAGIVHRDFKPDNVMVSADGRVRVMDFGLARAGQAVRGERRLEVSLRSHGDLLNSKVTQVGAVIGTPAYLAPEQWLGGDGDAHTDQFAFCVALWQGLYGERPYDAETMTEMILHVTTGQRKSPRARSKVPSWLRRTVERGMAVAPTDRWSTMSALLAALASGAGRRRRQWALLGVGLVAATIGAAIGVQRWQVRQQIRGCADDGRSIRSTWSAEAREGLRSALLASDARHATLGVERVEQTIDRFAEEWADAEGRVCLRRRVTGTWDQATAERAQECLLAARWSLAGLLAVLQERDPRNAQRAVQAAAGLPAVAPCLDATWLAHWSAAPRSREARAEVQEVSRRFTTVASLQAAGRPADAYGLARSLVLRADAVGWPSLAARARILAGNAAGVAGEVKQSAPLVEEGLLGAVEAGDESLIADAELGLMISEGDYLARHEAGLRWGRLAETRLRRLGATGTLRWARLLRNTARLHKLRLNLDEARRVAEEALALIERLVPPDHPEVTSTLDQLFGILMLSRAIDEAEVVGRRALALRERLLGPDHPEVAVSLHNLSTLAYERRAFDEARHLLERAIAIRERALGPNHLDVGGSLNNLAVMLQAQGDFTAAQLYYERALAITEAALPAEHPDVARTAINLGNVYTARGMHEAALRMFTRGLAIQEKLHGPDHPLLASALYGMGNVHSARGAWAEARRLFERVLVLREREYGPDHTRVADALNNMADADVELAESGAVDREEVLEEAERLQRRVLSMYGRILEPDDPEYGFPLSGLGFIELARKRPREAMAWFERAMQITRTAAASFDAASACRYGMAQAVWAAERDAPRARALMKEALALVPDDTLVDRRREMSAWLAKLPAR